MTSEIEISEDIIRRVDEIRQLNFLESRERMRQNYKEAEKYVERWLAVIRSELQQLEKEGADPYIAWLAIATITDPWEDPYRLGDLRPG